MRKSSSLFVKLTLLLPLVTVSVLPMSTSGASGASANSLGTNLSPIANIVQPIIDKAWDKGIRVSVGIEDLSGFYGGEGMVLGKDDTYKPASTIKMALVSALMQQVDQGILKLSDTVTVNPSDVVGGTGSLQKETFPQSVTLERLARLMITQSDNTATNVLIDVVGLPKVQALIDELNLPTMHLGRKMFASAPTPEQDNYINAADLTTLLKEIYDGTLLSVASRNQILTWMAAQEVETKFGAALPGAPIAHKTGENANVTHDAGFFLLPGREIAIAVMTEVTTTDDFDQAQAIGNPVVQEVAKAVYGQLVLDQSSDAHRFVTRAEFTSFLARELGLITVQKVNPFKDVKQDHPYYNDIIAAYESGIANGLSIGRFGSDEAITRAEMAVMFVRAYESLHGAIDTSYSSPLPSAASSVPEWAKAAVQKAYALQWPGYRDGSPSLEEKAQYAEMIALLSELWTPAN